MAYYGLNPFGDKRGDIQAAIISRTMAEIHRSSKKRPEPYRLDEFMLSFGGEQQDRRDVVEVDELSPAAQRAWLEMLNATFGGKDLR